MYKYNTKYFKGYNDVDNWIEISDDEAHVILNDLENHRQEMGYNKESFAEFLSESVIKEVGK